MLEVAVLFLVFFGPLAFGAVEPWSLAIVQAVIFAFPLLALRRGKAPVLAAPQSLLLGLGVLLSLGILQALQAVPPDGPLPLLPFTTSSWRTQKALLLLASYAVLLWCAPNGFSSSGASRRFTWAVVLAGFAVAVAGLVQSAYGNTHVLGFRPVGYGHSPFGPYYNNAHAASLLALSALMGLGLLGSKAVRAFGLSRREESLADSIALQVILAFLIGVILFALWSTRNRGSLLAFGGASLAVGWLACGFLGKPAARWGGRSAILAVFLIAAAAAQGLGLLARGAQSSVPVRLSMYRSGLQLLADSPLWGAGPGSVITVFAPYKVAVVEGVVDHVHNDWLELPLQSGVPAAAFMLVAMIAFGVRVHRSWMREASVERRLRLGGGIAAALCFALHAMVEFTWHIPANAVIFLLILSWLWSQTAPPTTVPARGKTAAFCALLALLAVPPAVGWELARRGQYDGAFAWDADPEYLRRSALQHLKAGRPDEARARAARALGLEPLNASYRRLFLAVTSAEESRIN